LAQPCPEVVETLSERCHHVVVRIQLHGRFTIEADGQALGGRLPGRRARLLVAYMAAHPHATLERSALIELLWQPEDPGPGAAGTFAALLSKTRAILTPGQICGRGELRLVLPADTLIDSERADAALHDAQAAAAGGGLAPRLDPGVERGVRHPATVSARVRQPVGTTTPHRSHTAAPGRHRLLRPSVPTPGRGRATQR
jgi:hypothetical protein